MKTNQKNSVNVIAYIVKQKLKTDQFFARNAN